MEFFLSQQISIFICAIVGGLLIGIINEPFRFLRYAGFNSKTEIFIQDIIFMLLSAFITFFFSLCYNKGEVRFFIIFGELIGFLIFRYTIGLLTGKIFGFIFAVIRKILYILKKFFNVIVTILTKFLTAILVKIPLFNKKTKKSCHKNKIYCIMSKSINTLFSKVFIKR